MRRYLSLVWLALALLACNLSERVLLPQQLPTLAVTPRADFIAPTAVPPSATPETITSSMVGQPGSMVADAPTTLPTLESSTVFTVSEAETAVVESPTPIRPQATTTLPVIESTGMVTSTGAVVGSACQPNDEWEASYTIVSGDRLSIIADRYGLTAQELAAANCIPNPDRISVGQVLIVPEGFVTAVPPSPIPLNTPDADGFTTYSNREYGFSLRYPPGWNRVEPGAYINLVSPDGSSVYEILIDETGTSPQTQADACRAGQGCPRGATIDGNLIELDGLPAYRIDLGGAGSLRVIVFLTLNGRDLAIRGFGDVAVFEQILGTMTIP